MKLSDYRKETLRTLPDLGSLAVNSIHMSAGIMTEVIELSVSDEEDILDESGDILWYISNYCNLHDIDLVYTEPEANDDVAPYDLILIHAGKLLDYDKKHLAYKKAYVRDKQVDAVNKLFGLILFGLTIFDITAEEVFEKNTAKLYVRYPDKFSGDQAINKNVEKEKEVFK